MRVTRESADRDVALSAGDLVTQLDSIGCLRRHRRLSAAEAEAVLVSTLQSLLGQERWRGRAARAPFRSD